MSVERNMPVEGRSRRVRMRAALRWPSVVLALAVGLIVAAPDLAHAYIGPGAGVTVLGALWAVIVAVVLALAGLLLWPIRVMMRRRKQPAAVKAAAASEPDGAGGA
jgi:type VI protein secretion system component VasK